MPRRPKINSSARHQAPQSIAESIEPTHSGKRAKKRDLCREYGVSPRTVDAWIHQRKIPYLKISPRVVRFDLTEVAKALSRFKIKEIS
jgi:hypothetical protein